MPANNKDVNKRKVVRPRTGFRSLTRDYDDYRGIPRLLRGTSPFPPSHVYTFVAVFNFTVNGGVTFSCTDFRINSLFAFAATLGTTNDFSGVTPVSGIYDTHLNLDIDTDFQVNSLDATQPVACGLVFKDAQPSIAVTTRAHAINALEVAPTTGAKVVGVATGMSTYRSPRYRMSMANIIGNPANYTGDIDFSATFGTNPAQAVWMAFISYAPGASTPATGIEVVLTCRVRARCYSLKTLIE